MRETNEGKRAGVNHPFLPEKYGLWSLYFDLCSMNASGFYQKPKIEDHLEGLPPLFGLTITFKESFLNLS